MKDSPYLEPCRLGDVIAAIQVLAYYKFYRLDVASWAERITGDRVNAASLEQLLHLAHRGEALPRDAGVGVAGVADVGDVPPALVGAEAHAAKG